MYWESGTKRLLRHASLVADLAVLLGALAVAAISHVIGEGWRPPPTVPNPTRQAALGLGAFDRRAATGRFDEEASKIKVKPA